MHTIANFGRDCKQLGFTINNSLQHPMNEKNVVTERIIRVLFLYFVRTTKFKFKWRGRKIKVKSTICFKLHQISYEPNQR